MAEARKEFQCGLFVPDQLLARVQSLAEKQSFPVVYTGVPSKGREANQNFLFGLDGFERYHDRVDIQVGSPADV
jgi:hypothetical protein